MVQTQHVLPTRLFLYKFLAAAYVVLLGFVLPFICWGTLATPGHPHQMAHLVFLMPPVREGSPINGADSHSLAPQHQEMKHDVEQSDSATQPAGRSVPAQLTSAISIISPLLLVQILLALHLAQSFVRLPHAMSSHLFDPRVLTPPPRFFLDCHCT